MRWDDGMMVWDEMGLWGYGVMGLWGYGKRHDPFLE